MPPTPSHRSTAFLLVFALANAGGVIGYLPFLTLLLPLKVEAIAGDARIGLLTVIVVAGALAASASNVLFGWLSDCALRRGNGRRPWMLGGLMALAASFTLVTVTTTPTTIVLTVVVFQVAVNALLAPLMAIMADEIPDGQKGIAGGLLALGTPLAAGVSALLVGVATLGEAQRLAIVVLATAACIAPLALVRAVPATAAASPQPRMARRDLALAWIARLLIQTAGSVLSLYLLYYFGSIVPGDAPLTRAGRVGQLLVLAYLLPLPIAILAGTLSDRVGRRKPFMTGTAIVAALGLAVMAMAGDWTAGATGFVVYATGSAVFLALHSGFAMQLLPDPAHRGRDLGWLNLANTVPVMLGPMLAWWLATPCDFGVLMLVLAGLTVLGGVAILAVRGRR